MEYKICKDSNRKCNHNNDKYNCIDCGTYGKYRCEHGRQCRSRCSDCLGHAINKNQCSRCRKKFIPEEGSNLQTCKDCRKPDCEHGKRAKKNCKECMKDIREKNKCCHDKRKNRCINCTPEKLCLHKILKENCNICNPNRMCHHSITKSTCIICKPTTKAYCQNCSLFRVNSYSKYLCSYCNPEKAIRQKTKEMKVKTLLEEWSYNFVYNKKCNLYNSCRTYFPDFLFDNNTFFLILECDEYAHTTYDTSCERIRENNICYSLGLPSIFIRYNPDKKKTIFGKKLSDKGKHIILRSYLDYYLSLGIVDNQTIYLFY
jgi:hypothetical protein